MQARADARTETRIGFSELQSRSADLKTMTIPQLWEQYERVFGETSSSRNKRYLVRRISYRLQEQVHGGLSRLAQERIAQLARNAPIRRSVLLLLPPFCEYEPEAPPAPAEPPKMPIDSPPPPERDPRLPAIGTVVQKTFHQTEYRVTVLEDGFEMAGKKYASLSGVARAITGSNWNGFLFFSRELKAAKGEQS